MAFQVRVFTNEAETTSIIVSKTWVTLLDARLFIKEAADKGVWDDANNTFLHARFRRAYSIEEI